MLIKSGASLQASMWSLGMVVGPSIGGLLSRPAASGWRPELFAPGAPLALLSVYPYLLPNLVCACVALGAPA